MKKIVRKFQKGGTIPNNKSTKVIDPSTGKPKKTITGQEAKMIGRSMKEEGKSMKQVGQSMKKQGQELKTKGKQIKQNNPLTSSELKALSHQQRGMPVSGLGYYHTKKGSGLLNDTEKAQLKRYMDKASTPQKVYEALPNIGKYVAKGASQLPSNSKLEKRGYKKGGKITTKNKK